MFFVFYLISRHSSIAIKGASRFWRISVVIEILSSEVKMNLKYIYLIFSTLIANGLCYYSEHISDRVCAGFGSVPSLTPNHTVTNVNKTLNIIFDTTGSMWDDLANLRSAAIRIVEKFRSSPLNSISEYVLSTFNDPGTDLFQTKNPDAFLIALGDIKPFGGGDCPELAMEGIINALRVSQPHSFAYVFTDADALDYERVDEVLELVTEKQIIVNFLTTDTCFGFESEGRLVYEKIATFSGGIVFDMIRSDVDNVLLAISGQLERDYVPIDAVELVKDMEAITPLKIDSSFSSVTISINGRRSMVKVTLEDGTAVGVKTVYTTETLRIVKFLTTGGSYKIITNAESDYSMRIGGASDLKFNFGFSLSLPSSIEESSIEPVWDRKNFLSIFVSNPAFIKCLFKVTISPLPSTHEALFEEFELDITRKEGYIFSTEKFTMPRGGFKIRVSGYDRTGKELERLISTGISEKARKLGYKCLILFLFFDSKQSIFNSNLCTEPESTLFVNL